MQFDVSYRARCCWLLVAEILTLDCIYINLSFALVYMVRDSENLTFSADYRMDYLRISALGYAVVPTEFLRIPHGTIRRFRIITQLWSVQVVSYARTRKE